MKNLRAKPQAQNCSFHGQTQSLTVTKQRAMGWNRQAMLVGLMMPMMMMVINMTMFGVALPTLRDTFGIQAEVTAWLVTAYALPFMIFMPS